MSQNTPVSSLKSNKKIWIAVLAVGVIAALIAAVFVLRGSSSSSAKSDVQLKTFCTLSHPDALDVDAKCQAWLDDLTQNHKDELARCKKLHDEKYPGDVYNCLVSNGNLGWTSLEWMNKYLLRSLSGHTGSIESIAFSPDGKTLASGSADKTIKLWDAASGSELRTLTWETASGQSVYPTLAFSPDGKTLAAGLDQTIKLWDAASGSELRTLTGHTGRVKSLAFSPDGQTLLSASYDGSVKLWEVASGNELRAFSWDKAASPIYSGELAFSADGKMLASSVDTTIKLWDVTSGSELRTLTWAGDYGTVNFMTALAFSPDGTRVVAALNKTIELWDVASGSELRAFDGHTAVVRGLTFSLDGKTLASGADDGTVRLWDAANGSVVHVLGQYRLAQVGALAISPDGKQLACRASSAIQIWSLP